MLYKSQVSTYLLEPDKSSSTCPKLKKCLKNQPVFIIFIIKIMNALEYLLFVFWHYLEPKKVIRFKITELLKKKICCVNFFYLSPHELISMFSKTKKYLGRNPLSSNIIMVSAEPYNLITRKTLTISKINHISILRYSKQMCVIGG